MTTCAIWTTFRRPPTRRERSRLGRKVRRRPAPKRCYTNEPRSGYFSHLFKLCGHYFLQNRKKTQWPRVAEENTGICWGIIVQFCGPVFQFRLDMRSLGPSHQPKRERPLPQLVRMASQSSRAKGDSWTYYDIFDEWNDLT